MKAMILAAGRGERMRPLTDTTPKPLLHVGRKRLIEYHIDTLKHAGFSDIVINTAWLAEQIHEVLGDGSNYGVTIQYSDEGDKALETGGGIYNALPLLGDDAFLVINGDIWCDYPYQRLQGFKPQGLAHLVLVDNPAQHPTGDFALDTEQHITNSEQNRLTFSGIGVYTAALFNQPENRTFPLAPLFRRAADNNLLSGEYYNGRWFDIGTPERLAELDTILRSL